jgi:O-antigen/teichoic acid export membrane protein
MDAPGPATPAAALPEPALIQRSVILHGLGGKAAELAGQVLLIALVPRVLGPSDYGTFATAAAIVTIGSASVSIGGPTLMARFVPAAAPVERTAVARALAGRIARWRALELAVLGCVAAVLVSVAPGDFPPAVTFLVVAALGLDAAATLAFQVALGLGATRLWSFRWGFQNALLVLAAVLGHAVAGVEGAVAGIVVASCGALAVGAAAVARPLHEAPPGVAVPTGALRFGALQGLGNVFLQLMQRGSIVAVAVLSSSSVQAGFAALAIGGALAATYVVWQLFSIQLPFLVEQIRDGDSSSAEAAAQRLALPVLGAATAVAALGVLALDPAIPLVLGERFREAEGAVAVALALIPLAPAMALASQAAALRLRPGMRAVTAGVGAVAFLATAAVAVPAWEAAGASAALLAGIAATIVASTVAFRSALPHTLVSASFGGAGLVLVLAALTAQA